MKINKEEIKKIIKEEFETLYGTQKLPSHEELIDLVGELRELVSNKNFDNKAFSDVVLEKLYWTIIDSYDKVRRNRNV